jgi:hypothetical protein
MMAVVIAARRAAQVAGALVAVGRCPATRRNRAPSGPRFRALALLERLSWEHVYGFVMQASEKPAQKQKFAYRQTDSSDSTRSGTSV